MSIFYSRLTSIGMVEPYKRIPFSPFIGTALLYRRGIWTGVQLQAYWDMDAAQWADCQLMFSKVLVKNKANKLLHDGGKLLGLAEWDRRNDTPIPELANWTAFLAALDTIAGSGHYD